MSAAFKLAADEGGRQTSAVTDIVGLNIPTQLRTGQGKRKREAEEGDAEQERAQQEAKPPEDLDATNSVVTQEEALQLLLQIKKGADIKDHLSSNVAAHLSNCKKCNGKLVVQAWKGDVGGNLRGNLYCLYCHTPAMQPILFMEKQELKEVRHMVHACGPISASFKSLKQVGERRPIVREGYYNTSDFLTPKEVLSGLDLKRIEEKRPTGGQKGVEHALSNEYKRGDYLTCNLQLKPEPSAQAKLLGDLRESQADMEWWADAMEARINEAYESQSVELTGPKSALSTWPCRHKPYRLEMGKQPFARSESTAAHVVERRKALAELELLPCTFSPALDPHSLALVAAKTYVPHMGPCIAQPPALRLLLSKDCVANDQCNSGACVAENIQGGMGQFALLWQHACLAQPQAWPTPAQECRTYLKPTHGCLLSG
ncbi:hypothetical protein ABBQ38_008600 [Trebouxia sp. C0009 RCD-2024]